MRSFNYENIYGSQYSLPLRTGSQTRSGEIVTGAALATRLGEYRTVYTITRAGMKVIGWKGAVLR